MAYEGHDAMYTGKPSKPGKTQVQIGYGVVEGDGVGFQDNGDLQSTGKVNKGVVGGGQRNLYEESTKTNQPDPFKKSKK